MKCIFKRYPQGCEFSIFGSRMSSRSILHGILSFLLLRWSLIRSLRICRIYTFQGELRLHCANRLCIHNTIISHILIFLEKNFLVIKWVVVLFYLFLLRIPLWTRPSSIVAPFFISLEMVLGILIIRFYIKLEMRFSMHRFLLSFRNV